MQKVLVIHPWKAEEEEEEEEEEEDEETQDLKMLELLGSFQRAVVPLDCSHLLTPLYWPVRNYKQDTKLRLCCTVIISAAYKFIE